ncbi:MAG: NYN domain-containing protein [Candidatus Edwardsbacteria bacterium]|nr:NYN domain-containing protein [Candidatus Edwardsbacteria bacterium]
MAKTIIIDGYNLAFASGKIRPVLLKEKKEGRALLLDILAGYKKALGYDITVIFDGAEGKEHKTDRVRGIKVVYSRPPQNADRVIKDQAAILKKTKALTVVTSDRELAHHVKGRQVEVIGSGQFLQRMEGELSRRGADKERPGRIDVKEWLEYFGIKGKE